MGNTLNSNLDEGYNFGSICKVQIQIFIVELIDSKKFGMVQCWCKTAHRTQGVLGGHPNSEWQRRGDTWLTILNSPLLLSPSPEPQLARLLSLLIYVATSLWAWRFYNWAWVTPKRIEKVLREQGFDGNPYKFLVGDLKEAHSKSIGIDDNTIPRIYPIVHKYIKKYGRKHFVWLGRIPRVTILDPEHVKEVLTYHNTFQKKFATQNPLCKLLLTGLGAPEGDKYHKHNKIISPAFHLEKLKGMVTAFDAVFTDLIVELKKMTESTATVELDVHPLIETVTCG
ncbi:secologanin synthase 2-like [Rhododendron vialii]|uniref:secologanin synthase 2-like n=1 Tax=Rhododendron vialii TaxID=182163 RepID=UPI00265ECEC6|nr:secologanin synthase 2-like [Rhododendron vialii]